MIAIYIIAFILGAWFVLPYVIRKVQVLSLHRLCRRTRTVVLTYDDGPGHNVTPMVINLLESFSATATFFPLGWKLEVLNPHSTRHELGSHSYRHLHAWKTSPIAVYRDIDRGMRALPDGTARKLFRPPYGKVTLATLVQLWMRQCSLAWWTIDSSDTWSQPLPIPQLIQRIRQDGGGVVLMHDHDRLDDPEREAYVLELTQAILEFALREGFRVCTMGEVLGISSPSKGWSKGAK